MTVNTKKVVGRRELRFHSLDDVLADLVALEGKPLKTLGNWSVGQLLAHLAVPMNGAIDGMKLSPPITEAAAAGVQFQKFRYDASLTRTR